MMVSSPKTGVWLLVCLCLTLCTQLLSFQLQPHATAFTTRSTSSQWQKKRIESASLLQMSFPQKETREVRKFQRKFGTIMQKVQYIRLKKEEAQQMNQDPLIPKIERIVQAALDRKAGEIVVLRTGPWTEVAQFMVILEGNSKPQVQAIALSIEDAIDEDFQELPFSKEGKANSGWMLLDYGDVMVHIMTPQTRAFYKLEKRWKDAESYDISHLVPNPALSSSSSASSAPTGNIVWDEDASYEENMQHLYDDGDSNSNNNSKKNRNMDAEEDGLVKDETDPFWS